MAGLALVPDWMLADWLSDSQMMRAVAGRDWLGRRPRELRSTVAEPLWVLRKQFHVSYGESCSHAVKKNPTCTSICFVHTCKRGRCRQPGGRVGIGSRGGCVNDVRVWHKRRSKASCVSGGTGMVAIT